MSSSGARVRQQYVADPLPPKVEEPPATERQPSDQPTRHDPAPAPQRTAAKSSNTASNLVDFPSARPAFVPSPYEPPPAAAEESIIERSTMVKGYEYEKGRFVLFTPEELRALEAGSRKTIDIVSFIPEHAVDPIFYDKAYLLAPDKRGSKPYTLLLRAMRETRRCAIAKWAFRSKEYVVQIRAAEGGIVLQQLFYAEEVRSFADLHIDSADIGDAELDLAKQLIEHIAADSYDPTEFVDEEKRRILAAVAEKVAGKVMAAPKPASTPSGQVVNLLDALRASLQAKEGASTPGKASNPVAGERKPAKRAPTAPTRAAAAPAKARSRKR
jgi:DNA end-binding protein Ku